MRPRRSVSMPDGQNLRVWSEAELIALADRMQQGLDIQDRSGMLLHYLSKLLLAFFSHISIKILFSISLLCELMHGIPYIVQLIKAHHQFLCCARVHHFKKRLSYFSGTVRWLIKSGNAGVPLYLVM